MKEFKRQNFGKLKFPIKLNEKTMKIKDASAFHYILFYKFKFTRKALRFRFHK